MKDETVDFAWLKTKDGYQWVEGGVPWAEKGNAEPQLWLCEKGAIRRAVLGYEDKLFNPLEDTSLFIRFAELSPDSYGDILDFANRYGLLTDGEEICETITQTKLTRKEAEYLQIHGVKKFTKAELEKLGTRNYEPGNIKGHGDPAELWIEQIRKMKKAWVIWNAVKKNNLKIVHEEITFYHPKGMRRATPPKEVVIRQALRLVQKIINDQMKGLVSPRLLFERDGKHLGRYFRPHNLLGALWLQIADAVGENRKFRKCRVCLRPFEIARGENSLNKNAEVCSGNCRLRRYRERIAQAKRMSDHGLKIESIAKKLGINLETARKWTSHRRKNRSVHKVQTTRKGETK